MQTPPISYQAKFKRFARRLLPPKQLQPVWIKKSGWLADHVPDRPFTPKAPSQRRLILDLAFSAEDLGKLPLWEGYEALAEYRRRDTTRSSGEVSTSESKGLFFTNLVVARRPEVIVEFGTAFGISGMYWLAGMEAISKGHLYTFEPNAIWADVARQNLSAIGPRRYTLTNGTFEDNVNVVKGIDIAFIDAIHTSEFVLKQFALVAERANPSAVVLFDDIEFSDDMVSCWKRIASEAKSSVSFGDFGVVEL